MFGRQFTRINRLRRQISIQSTLPAHQYLVESTKLKELVAGVTRELGPERGDLLAIRSKSEPLSELRRDTTHIRDDPSWKGATIPKPLNARFVEITGPLNDTKMVINAFNSNANGYMGDLEDSMSPTWSNVVSSMDNVYQASRNQISYSHGPKKYQLNQPFTNGPTFHLRPRGLHLEEANVRMDDGTPVPAMVWDICSHLYHNHTQLGGCNFYIPKLETME